MDRIPRRTLLTGAAALAVMPITGVAARVNRRRIRDLIPLETLRYYDIEEHADRMIDPGTEVAVIDPDTGESITLI